MFKEGSPIARFINPAPEFRPSSKLYFFKSGTSSHLETFKDEAQTIPNTRPVLCDSSGLTPNIFYEGSARLIVEDQNGVQYIERDPVGGEKELGNFTLWDTQVIYNQGDIVKGSDGRFYQSFGNDNQGSDPTTQPSTDWFEIRFIVVYNANKIFTLGEICQTSDGSMWKSQISANQGNDPLVDDGSNWLPAVDSSKIPEIIKLNWQNQNGNFSAVNNEAYQIDASSNTVDITLPTIAAGNAFTFHNETTSTNKVQILNPAYSIRASGGTISAGTDMELAAGDSVQLVAKSTTVLEIVGAQV